MNTKLQKTTKVNPQKEVLYPVLSYKITGILIEVFKEMGSYGREKQYCDSIEKKFIDENISYKRELTIGDSGNRVDFIIEDKIVLEIKAQPFLITQHYDQVKRYLYQTNIKLGLLVNFRTRYLQPKRILNIYGIQV